MVISDQRHIRFIDTENKDMYQVGWILRNRKVDSNQELTYKKDIQSMMI
ncbi:hypothetical protein [Bacillus thuringiensis]|nr:hypothetical protein [Bacillus thuringiensis]MED3526403.1 hypothetical protein [Bacillus thuringiensis]